MNLPFVNDGRPFVPETTLRDLLEAAKTPPAVNRGEEVERMLAAVVRILQRTDSTVTADVVLDGLRPWELESVFFDLFRKPKEAALGEAAPPDPTSG